MSESLLVLVTVIVLLYVLIRDLVAPAVAFLGAVLVVLAAEVITPAEALSGFSSPVLFIIASLFVIAKAIQNSVNTASFVSHILGKKARLRLVLARQSVPVALLSGFIANTPIVATLIQPIEGWAREHKVSVSKLLMPLSYAAILGGVLTLTGTSTNLVVSGLLVEVGQDPLGYFEITKLGLPVAAAGLVVLVLAVPKLLPERKAVAQKESIRNSVTEYTALDAISGKSVTEAGLRNLKSIYLASIIRENGDIVAPVNPKTVIRKGDTLQFVGDLKDVVGVSDMPGLKLKIEKHKEKLGLKSSNFYEVVLGHDSPAVNRTLKEMNFRGYYQSAVFAINRSGEKIVGKLGDIRMKVGDTLLLVADDYFEDRWEGEPDFLLISKIEGKSRIHKKNVGKLSLIGVGVVAAAIIMGLELLTVLMIAAVLAVVTNTVTLSQARRAIDFDLLILIASSISFAGAVINSGLSDSIANGLIDALGSYGDIGLLISLVLTALILTEFVTNTASATLLFPIAIASASAIGSDPRIYALVLAVSCSLSFLSPLGYQTNTMVLGPGGYKFTDFTKVGFVLTLVASATLIAVASTMV